jgi:hypothetical protein
MSNGRPQDIWIEQCDAAGDISAKFGLKASFDYLVGEKLMNFMEAAVRHPEFARELPRFVSEVRGTFNPELMHDHLARIEREHAEQTAIELEDGEYKFVEDARETERWAARFAMMKDLLTSAQLGTS